MKPVLDMIAPHDDPTGVPLGGGTQRLVGRRREEPIQRGGRLHRLERPRVAGIVEDLILAAEPARAILTNAVFDAAVASRGDPPGEREAEVLELVGRDDRVVDPPLVALPRRARREMPDAVDHLPAGGDRLARERPPGRQVGGGEGRPVRRAGRRGRRSRGVRREAIDPLAVVRCDHEVGLAFFVLAPREHGHLLAGNGVVARGDPLHRIEGEREEFARDIVGVEVAALELRHAAAAVDEAAGDRGADGVVVFEDRIDQILTRSGAPGPEGMPPLAEVPAVVATAGDDVDLLVRALAHVGRPEQARRPVERHPPHVPQAVGPDLSAGARHPHERIVGWNRVGQARVPAVDVDPQDGAEQRAEILGVAIRIVAGAAVAERDIEFAVGPEGEGAAVVVPERLRHHEQFLLRRRVDAAPVAGRPQPGDDRGARVVPLRGVIDEALAGVGEPRMEGQAEQPLLVLLVGVDDAVAEVGEDAARLRTAAAGRRLDHVDDAVLLDHEDPPRAVPRVRHEHRAKRLRPALLVDGVIAVPTQPWKRRLEADVERPVDRVGRRRVGPQFPDADVAVGHLVAMVLQADSPPRSLAELREGRELAGRDLLVPVCTADLERRVADAVEGDLTLLGRDAERERVPLAGRPRGIDRFLGERIGSRRVEPVEPAGPLRILARGVVQHLHLGSGVPRLRRIFRDAKHDAAVAAGRNPVIELQLEPVELVGGDDVAGASGCPHERAVDHLPARRDGVGAEGAPALRRLAVEQPPPARMLLGRGERVCLWCLRRRQARRHGGEHEPGDHRPGQISALDPCSVRPRAADRSEHRRWMVHGTSLDTEIDATISHSPFPRRTARRRRACHRRPSSPARR